MIIWLNIIVLMFCEKKKNNIDIEVLLVTSPGLNHRACTAHVQPSVFQMSTNTVFS